LVHPKGKKRATSEVFPPTGGETFDLRVRKVASGPHVIELAFQRPMPVDVMVP
jgi:hypothetical protein